MGNRVMQAQVTQLYELYCEPKCHDASSSSPSSTENAASKRAQYALAATVRAGKYMRGALDPLGVRLSGLLGPYQQPVKYNLTVAREVLKHVYAAEDLQLPVPTFLGAVLGTYGTLWVRAREVGYWCEVVCSGEFVQLSVYAVEAYGIFKIGEIVGRRSFVGYNVQ